MKIVNDLLTIASLVDRDRNRPEQEKQRSVKLHREAYQVLRLEPRSFMHRANQDWIRFVFSIHRPCQIEAFAEIAPMLSDRMYWKLLGNIFWKAKNHAVYQELWLELLRARRRHHHCFHTVKQQEGSDMLPEHVRIYRGHGPKNQFGIFYSLRFETALALALDYVGTGKVSTYTVSKHDLFYGGGHLDAVFYVKGLGDSILAAVVDGARNRT